MFRLSVCRIAKLLLLGGVLAIGGCSFAGTMGSDGHTVPLREHFEDQTPAYVEPGALDSVVLIHEEQTMMMGSGTVIAPDRVLTAAHVIADMPRDDRGRLPIHVDGRPMTAVVEAVGDPDLPHGDWALLAFERAYWSQVAVVHEPTRAVGWRPLNNTEILLVGYAGGFFPERSIDVDAPTPCVVARIQETDPVQPAWYAAGDLVKLSGMSGGAAMVWNPTRKRPELIGIFRGYVGTETVTTEQTKILGVVTSVRETRQPGIAFTIHRLPALVTNPGSPAQ